MPALRSQWRQYEFFDRQLIEDPPAVFTLPDLHDGCLARDHLYLFSAGGDIHIVDQSFNTHSFSTGQPLGRLTFARVGGRDDTLLVTLTEEEEVAPTLRVWDISKVPTTLPSHLTLISPSSPVDPILLRSIPIRTSDHPYPATSLSLYGSLEQIAIGFANGQVILVAGDILRDRNLKQRSVFSSPEPVTSLNYRSLSDPSLYITTVARTLMCDTSPGGKDTIHTLDEIGAAVDCAIVSRQGYLVVAREEAIYYYNPDGRGPCFALDGPKSALFWCDGHLGILSQVSEGLDAQMAITLFDPEHKFVSHTSADLVAPIPLRVAAWGGLFLLTGDRQLYRLQELDTEAKLRILTDQSLYVLAISLARRAGYDSRAVSAIIRRYADHLYAKADYDASMTQYQRTIGYLEPSYVIRKFLDAQRIRHLTTYLQDLHLRDLATAEHTTLLINCYTKLGDTKRLEKFIKSESGEVRFDVETAVAVCRQAGYHDLALHLAKRFGDHETYLKIQLDHAHNYPEALQYMATQLSPEERVTHLRRYGRKLLTERPEETIALLINLCSPPPPASMSSSFVASRHPLLPSLTSPAALNSPSPPPPLTNPFAARGHSTEFAGQGPSSASSPSHTTKPSLFVDLFAGNEATLVTFLEGVAPRRWPPSTRPDSSLRNGSQADGVESTTTTTTSSSSTDEEEEKKLIYGTLLELYLSQDDQHLGTHDEGEAPYAHPDLPANSLPPGRAKAMDILEDHSIPLDIDQALVMCHASAFDDGVLILYDRRNATGDTLRFHMLRDDVDAVLRTLEKKAPEDAKLHAMVLNWLASSPIALMHHQAALVDLMGRIDAKGMMPPLRVLRELGRNSITTIGTMRTFISARVLAEKAQKEASEADIQRLRLDTEKKVKELNELRSDARVFQVSRCTGCGGALDLPTVHFMCRHSFHQRCLGDNESITCPKCTPEVRKLQRQREEQEKLSSQHAAFFNELKHSKEGFKVIADYFGKNVMGSIGRVQSS